MGRDQVPGGVSVTCLHVTHKSMIVDALKLQEVWLSQNYFRWHTSYALKDTVCPISTCLMVFMLILKLLTFWKSGPVAFAILGLAYVFIVKTRLSKICSVFVTLILEYFLFLLFLICWDWTEILFLIYLDQFQFKADLSSYKPQPYLF